MNIVLCGMMGCGKSTVARVLAQKGGFALIDTDEQIVKMYGDIPSIFEKFGEERFRQIEADVIKQACKEPKNAVISLGGGAVLRRENVNILKKSGKIVYLRATKQTLSARLEGCADRPLLRGNIQERVHAILSERASIYEDVADIIIDTDKLSPEQIADKIRETVL